jgi:soluble lytic murein transglycosylase-like protein
MTSRRFERYALLGALLCAAPARADLVVFEDGRVVKAVSWHLGPGSIEIVLAGGGSFTADLKRVDRIVEDEVVSQEEVARELPELPPAAYDLAYRADRKPLFETPWNGLIEREAKRQNVDAALVSAVIRAESNGNPRSVSRKGARGLMQLMPATARRLDVRFPFDPAQNVRGGVRYLKELAKRFESKPELVLAAYNAGEAAVSSFGGVPPYRETVGYVKRILGWWTPAVLR